MPLTFSIPPRIGPAPGLVLAASRSGAGKTTVTLGLGRALTRRGLVVQPVKNGPDYIDAAFQAAATGRPSLNLDTFAMSDELLSGLAGEAADGCDIVLAEGAMGLHDGSGSGPGRTGSSADLAVRFGWPVVLVVDVTAQAATAAAVALGLAAFDPRVRVAGVILNRVASDRHRQLVEVGFERIDIPVLGALPRDATLSLPERHLGLVQAEETTDLSAKLDRLADVLAREVDLDRILSIAAPTELGPGEGRAGPAIPPPGGRIALARDEAFSFMYAHVLSGWRRAGATILPFSPLADEPPPDDADCCWLPGGYPELHAGRLASASRFKNGLAAFAEHHAVHGECGGYMVLGETLEDAEGVTHPMAALLPVRMSFARRRLHLGYRIAQLDADCALGAAGTVLTGHEFHYAAICDDDSAPADLARVSEPGGRVLGPMGHRRGRVSGSFFHAIATGGRSS